MRAILIDWLVEVHNKFKLNSPSLWLCVQLIDRFLSVEQVPRARLQLVGVAALLIATKFEEVNAPEVKDCSYITDHAFDKAQILQMENRILTVLDYQLFVPTGYHFLVRYLNSIQAPDRLRYLAFYYAERNLQEYDSLTYKPHHFAASALYAALMQSKCWNSKSYDLAPWGRLLEEETGLKDSELITCATAIVTHVSEEPETASKRRLVAAKKKYGHDRFLYVSSLPLPSI